MQKLDLEIPDWLKSDVAQFQQTRWLKGRSKYRHCRAIYFGTADAFNAGKKKPIEYAAGSRMFPEFQKRLLEWIGSVAPTAVFNRIVMNIYDVGESMGGHTDGNDEQNSVQFVARWKTADCQGGQLWTEGGEADAGCFWVDGNQRHGVHVVERGQMFSIVTFAKNLQYSEKLLEWGFPLGHVVPKIAGNKNESS